MITRTFGINNHLALESFERTHAHLLRIGFPALDAMRGALAMTFMLSGSFTVDEAWEAADEIMDPYKQCTPVEVTSTANESS